MSLDIDVLHDRLVKSIYEANEKQTTTLKAELRAEITEVKGEITVLKNVIQEETNKRSEIEKIQCDLGNRCLRFERALKKNNIIIFGLEHKPENLVEFTIVQLNSLLGLNLTATSINNIYAIGKPGPKQPILVEFVSFLIKIKVLKECKKLKGTQISIAQDLTKEDREIQKILLKHKREAQGKGHRAYIKNNKLYINDDIYTVEDLEETEYVSEEEQGEGEENKEELVETQSFYTQKTSNSAPATPTGNKKLEGVDHPEEEEDPIEKTKITKKRKITKIITHTTGPVTRKFHQRNDNKKKSSPIVPKTKVTPNQNQLRTATPTTSTDNQLTN